MTGKRMLLLVAAVLLGAGLLLLALTELGVLDLHLYRAETSTETNSSYTFVRGYSGGPGYKAYVPIRYGDDLELDHSAYVAVENAPTGTAAELNIPVHVIPTVSGNDWLPLYKSFTVEFAVAVDPAVTGGDYQFSGKLTGTTRVRIIGLCSRARALDLAKEEIVHTVMKYFQDALTAR